MDIRRFGHRRVRVVIGALFGPWLFGVCVSSAAADDFALGFLGLIGLVERAFGLHAWVTTRSRP